MGRVLQFSDVHFGVEHKHACAAALDYAHAEPSDLILITGDITQKGYPDEFAAAGAWIKAMPTPRFARKTPATISTAFTSISISRPATFTRCRRTCWASTTFQTASRRQPSHFISA